MMFVALVLGCSGPKTFTNPNPIENVPPNDTLTVDTEGVEDPPDVDTDPEAFHGVVPDPEVPPPDFASVVNYDGNPRTAEDLKGKATALWFYPAAATNG